MHGDKQTDKVKEIKECPPYIRGKKMGCELILYVKDNPHIHGDKKRKLTSEMSNSG